ncbi:MAG: Ltp family lipoprotein, partial [Ancrocorticia sp.]|nr:Ltp family lipoprotein [Ancrocorticia sp.]
TTASKSSAKTAKVAKLSLKKGSPKVSGTAKVGKKLTVKRGTWTSGTSFKYQWYRDGKAISKATKTSYTLKAADAGKRISVKVKGSKPGYTTASKSSAKTSKVAKGTLKSGKPSISGTVRVGKTVTAKTGTWSSGTKLTYQWYRNGKVISGAKSAKYKVKTADIGKRLTVKVTGTKAGYNKVARTSVGTIAKSMTTGQKNAVGTAKSYLSFMPFSRSGLIDQLKYEGYTKAQATFAVDYIAPNWKKQAVASAKSYLSFMPFSRSGLIDQLKYEGFTSAQAKYGVDHSGANWNKQAAKCAKDYMKYGSFSRQALLDQLLYEGFTKSQAQYGLKAVGY